MASDQLRLRKKTLQAVLQQCHDALELLRDEADSDAASNSQSEDEVSEDGKGRESDVGYETDELRDLLKSKFESPEFREKLGGIHASFPQTVSEEGEAWDIITTKDLWEAKHVNGHNKLDEDDFVLVKQEDIVDGIACFMAAYLMSLEQAKDLTPNQLQEALSKTFSVKKKKSKLQKAWDGSKVIYNVASWSATAIGIYQNPAILSAASTAFWTSCRMISKLL